MPLLSTPISRRYTPPTCTLEITAQTSALSRWAGRSVLKQLQFQLSFEDLRQWDQSVQIRGDRAQLEALGEAVESYVQQLLSQPLTDSKATAAESMPKPAPALSQPEFIDQERQGAASTPNEPLETEKIHLRPKSFLSHDLVLGSLANETSGSVVNLSASGLFDLASALEESSAEALTLPSPQNQHPNWLQHSPLWTRVAAIAVLFVGVTTAVLQSNDASGPDSTAPVVSQNTNETPDPDAPLPPPPNATLPPFQNLPPVTVPPTLPSTSAPPNPTTQDTTPNPGQSAPNTQRSAAPTPVGTSKVPEQNIPVQPKASGAPSALPEVPDIETSITNSPESSSANQDAVSSGAAESSETAFDVVPQVAEVRNYFQKRWQPPQSLNQTLEYSLSLNPNGSIQQTVPLNSAAKTYLDRTPMPLRNEPFVSPLQGSNTKIRLVLGPDGSVKAFLQPAN